MQDKLSKTQGGGSDSSLMASVTAEGILRDAQNLSRKERIRLLTHMLIDLVIEIENE